MQQSPALIIMILSTLVAILATVDLVYRRRRRGARASAVLMQAAGLDREERRLLRRIARAAKLPNAGCLLLSRGCFQHATDVAARHGIDRSAIERLHERLASDPQARGE